MNKKIIFSLSIIGIISAVVVGGTMAYFSDSRVSEDNQFTAGTILLETGVDGPVFEVEGKPCEEWKEVVTLKNIGANDGIADLHFRNVVNDGGDFVRPECEAEGGEWVNYGDHCAGEHVPVDNISEVLNVNIGYDRDGENGIEEDEYLIWSDSNQNGVIEQNELSFGDNPNPDNAVATLAQLESIDFDLGDLPAANGEENGERKLEISLHLQWDAGNEYQGDFSTFDIEFTLHQAMLCEENKLLDYVDIGNESSETGHLSYSNDGWSWIGDTEHDSNNYLKHGGYGGYDGGEANFRGLMGPDTGCNETERAATFRVDAGSGIANKLVLRHLDGQKNDSFDVFIVQDDTDYFVGHYEWDGQESETWETTGFYLPSSATRTGEIEFKLVATDPETQWCASGWGQVMFNWTKLRGCK